MTHIQNAPALWSAQFPKPDAQSHKYTRGLAVIYGAPEMTGATRLAATACARMGAGVVNVLCTPQTVNVYRTALPPHIIVRDDMDWTDARVTAKLYGSGGLARDFVYDIDVPTVLDAAALDHLPAKLNENFILTPHAGEFARAFPDCADAPAAARKTGACVVLKGARTVMAHPTDGRGVVNDHASPYLATAGSGDVLAGLITGLLAQGMRPFDAACAAVWMHGECGLRFGAGLVASDIEGVIPEILKEMLGISDNLG